MANPMFIIFVLLVLPGNQTELIFIVTMRILMLGFGLASAAIELKDRGTSVQTAAAVRHLVGSLTRAEGLRFAVVSASILT